MSGRCLRALPQSADYTTGKQACLNSGGALATQLTNKEMQALKDRLSPSQLYAPLFPSRRPLAGNNLHWKIGPLIFCRSVANFCPFKDYVRDLFPGNKSRRIFFPAKGFVHLRANCAPIRNFELLKLGIHNQGHIHRIKGAGEMGMG